jgi:hypothetical protein
LNRPLPPERERALSLRLAETQKRVDESGSPPEPTLLHQLGDICAELGRRPHALDAYGRAIDGFLMTGRLQVALAICHKVIRRYASVTRTHFTVGCIAFHLGRTEEALHALDAYVTAALASETASMAIPRLRFLAALIVDRNVRASLGALLTRLGDDGADRVSRGDPPSAAASLTEEKRASLLIAVAVSGSDTVWSRYWMPS